MSFILDALRKSETERQKAQVPGIGDAPLVVHQKHVPRWTVGLIACLSGCLMVLGWFWLRGVGTSSELGMEVTSTQSATGTGPAPSLSTPASLVSATTIDTPLPVGEVTDLSEVTNQVATEFSAPAIGNAPAASASASTMAVSEAPAVPIRTVAQFRALGGTLPELNLELHVYSPTASERFVFINASKYEEGQTLAEGPLLGAITRDGAVLMHQGQSLLLPRE